MMYHSKMRIEDMPKICGYYATAKHLKNRGYTIEQTLWMLLKTTVRESSDDKYFIDYVPTRYFYPSRIYLK